MNDVWMNHVKMCNIIAHFQSARDMQNKGKNVKIKIEGKKKKNIHTTQTKHLSGSQIKTYLEFSTYSSFTVAL